ncbi:MAG: deoxyribodipyrimidine photo-lyase, partial [Pseudomonadota bacterium]
MSDKPIIVLFHRDLRVMDHPALSAACDTGAPVIALYICDEAAAGDFTIGGASKWWLHHSLARLSEKLDALGGALTLRRGDTVSVLKEITDAHNVGGIYIGRGYEPWVVERETAINEAFSDSEIAVKRFAGRLLIDPDTIRTKTGAVYKVYTPFWRAVRDRGVRAPIPAPKKIPSLSDQPKSDALTDWDLLPTKPNWAAS